MATTLATTRLLRGSSTIKQLFRLNNVPLRSPILQNLNKSTRSLSQFQRCSMNRNILMSRCVIVKFYTNPADKYKPPANNDTINLSLLQRFKQMYRDYWYVLVPVHLVTSACWFGGFYYLAKSGIDIVSIMESWHISEKIINPLKDSSMGYIAVAYALYKLATPFRYTVTIGGTTISIKYLKEWGYIKPVPSTQEMRDIFEIKRNNLLESMKETKEMYKERKGTLIQQMKGTKEDLLQKKDVLKTKKDDLMGDFEEKLRQMKEDTKNIKIGRKPEPVIDLDKKSKEKI